MSERPDWPSAFLAVSFLLGEPTDAAETALGDQASPQASILAKVLRSSPREARARAVARVAAGLLLDLEKWQFA